MDYAGTHQLLFSSGQWLELTITNWKLPFPVTINIEEVERYESPDKKEFAEASIKQNPQLLHISLINI